jgi:hypothetical protein
MATTTVKTTYALDLETVGALDALAPAAAARWASQVRAERRAGSRRREEQTR